MMAIGMIMWIGSGLILYVFEVIWFYRWWGDIGAVVGILVPPVAIVFPFLFLLKEGFSGLYFGAWVLGILGLVVSVSGRSRS